MNKENKIIKEDIPDHVIDFFIKKYNKYPSIIQTRNIVFDGIETLTKKNKILWFNKFFDGVKKIIKEALIEYSDSHKIFIYIKRNENESIYKLYIITDNNDGDYVNLLLKGLNKFFTIDSI